MANSSLENNRYQPTEEVLNHLSNELSKNKEQTNSNGYKRVKNILSKKELTYPQMKMIKSFFDNYNGDGTDVEYQLSGGEMMKKWVETALKVDRDKIHHEKEIRMDAGEDNQFKKTHTKDKDNKNPTKIIVPKMDSTLRNIISNSVDPEPTLKEEITRIKQLINYINNIKK